MQMANKLIIDEKKIVITCDRNDIETIKLVGQIPYVHKNRINTEFKTTIRNIDLVLKLFRNIDASNIDTAPLLIQELFDKEMRRRIATKSLRELGPDESHEWLWKHQMLGIELANVNDRYGFFYDTRTGKTPMSLKIISDDIAKNPGHKWLILCPLILIKNAWLQDADDMFPHLRVVNTHASTRAKRLKQFALDGNVYLANSESFIDYREEIEKLKIHGCFLDESSSMKSNSSKFANAAAEYAVSLQRWYLLSGTPAPNSENEYYKQLQSIDFYGVHQSYAQFCAYFFFDLSRDHRYNDFVLRQDRYDEFIKLVQEYSLYVDQSVLNTPGRTFETVEYTLEPELKQHYNDMKEKLAVMIGDTVVVTKNIATKLNKLNQISSGFVMDTAAMKRNKAIRFNDDDEEEGQEVYELSDQRFRVLDDLLKQFGDEQVIIWANYHKEFEVIQKMYGSKCSIVNGTVNITAKNKAISDFKEGKIQYLVANPASADKGLTLVNAHIAVYFSMNYSYELWKQSMERIYGDIIKQPKPCKYYILIAKGTVDKIIFDTVTEKGAMGKAILDHLKAEAL